MEIRDWSKRAVKTSAPRDLTESAQVATRWQAPLHCGAEVQRQLLSSNLPVVAQPSSSLSADDSFSRLCRLMTNAHEFIALRSNFSIVVSFCLPGTGRALWRCGGQLLESSTNTIYEVAAKIGSRSLVTWSLRLGWRTFSSLVYHLWFMCAERSLHCL